MDNQDTMKIIIKKAVYGRLPISLSRYLIEGEREIYETDIKSKKYKGFTVEFVEHLNLDKTHLDYIVKKVNGQKVDLHYTEVRKYIDRLIERVFEKINGNKESCLDDVFFTSDIYVKKAKTQTLEERADTLLINARYKGSQTNWCFEYLYEKGLSLPILATYL